MGNFLRASLALTVIFTTAITGCTRQQHLSPLAPQGLHYPASLILLKDQPLSAVTPSIDELHRQTPTFSYEGTLPEGINFDPATGAIDGVPTASMNLTPITVTATTMGGSVSAQIMLAVNDRAVEFDSLSIACTMFNSPNQTFPLNVTYLPAGASFSLSGALAGLSINPANGMVSCNFTQWPGSLGSFDLDVIGSSLGNQPVTKPLHVQVIPVAPEFSYSALPAVVVGQSIPAFSATQTRPLSAGVFDHYELKDCTVTKNGVAAALPASQISTYIDSAQFDAQTGKLSGSPNSQFYSAGITSASFSCNVTAHGPLYSNNLELTATHPFSFSIGARAPICRYSNVNIISGQALNVAPIADPASGPITSYALNSPSSLSSIFSANGKFVSASFTATPGSIPVSVTSTGPGGQSSCSFSINVNPNITYANNNTWVGYKMPGSTFQASQISANAADYVNAFYVKATPSNYPAGVISAVPSPAFPAGVSINAATGIISGVSTNVPLSNSNYTIRFTLPGNQIVNVPFSLNAFQPPKLVYDNASYSYYVNQNNAHAISISKGNSSSSNLVNFTVSPSNAGVIVDSAGTLTVSLDNPIAAQDFTVCANYSATYISQNNLPSNVKDCTVANIKVLKFSFAYSPSTIHLRWNQAIPAGIIPTVTNGPAVSFSAGVFPAGLGSFNTGTGLISSPSGVVTALPNTYSITVSAVGPNQTSASQIITLIVDPVPPPVAVYNNPNTFGPTGALNSTTNPWVVSNLGAAALNPTVTGTSPTGYTLSGCTLSTIGLAFNSTTGIFSSTSNTRSLGSVTCSVKPFLSAGTTRIDGATQTFVIRSSQPKIVILGMYDSPANNANLIQGTRMNDTDQDSYQVELDLGRVTLGALPKNVYIRIKNIGDYPATNIRMNVSANPSFSSSPSPVVISDLSAGSVSTFNMQFSPQVSGVLRGLLKISYNNGSTAITPRSTALVGMGLKIRVSSTALDFGKTPKILGVGIDRWQEISNPGDTELTYTATYNHISGTAFKFGDLVVTGIPFQSMGTPASDCKSNKIAPNTSCYFAVFSNGGDHNSQLQGNLTIAPTSVAGIPNSAVAISYSAVGEDDPALTTKCNCDPFGTQKLSNLNVSTQSAIDSLPYGRANLPPISVCDTADFNKLSSAIPGFYNSDNTLNKYVGWKGLSFRQCQDISGVNELLPASLIPIGKMDAAANKYIPFLGTYDGAYRLFKYVKIEHAGRTENVALFGALGLGGKITRVRATHSIANGGSAKSVSTLIGTMGDGDYNSIITPRLNAPAELSYNIIHSAAAGKSQVGGVAGTVGSLSEVHHNEFLGFSFGKSDAVGGLIGSIAASGSANSVKVHHNTNFGVVSGVPSSYNLYFDLSGSNADAVGGLVGKIQNIAGSPISTGAIVLDSNYSGNIVTGGFTSSGSAGGMVGAVTSSLPLTSTINFLTIQNSVSSGIARGPMKVGGLVGSLSSSSQILDSKSFTTVMGDYSNYVLSAQNPPESFGGLVGQNEGTVSRSVALGDVSYWDSSTSDSSYAATNNSAMGGFVGTNLGGVITLSSAYGRLNGVKMVGGFVGSSLKRQLAATCTNLGSGLCGFDTIDYGSISASASYGSVNKNPNGLNQTLVGGFAGSVTDSVIHNSISFSSVVGTNDNTTGGFAGGNDGFVLRSVAANSSVSISAPLSNTFAKSNPDFGSTVGRGIGDVYFWSTGIIPGQFEQDPYKKSNGRATGVNRTATAAQLSTPPLFNDCAYGGTCVRFYAEWTTTGTAQNLGFMIPKNLPALDQ